MMLESNSVSLIKESIFKFFATLVTKAGALIFVILLARFLQPEGFGIYNLAMSIVLALVVLTDAGINSSLLRYVSDELAKGKKAGAAAYFRYLFKIKLILTSVFSLLLLVLSWPLSFYFFKKPELFVPLIILSFYLIALSFETFFEYLMYSLKKVRYLFIKEIIFQTIKIVLALLVFFTLTEKFYIDGVVFSLLLAQIGILLFFIFLLKNKCSFIFKKSSFKIDKKKIWRFMKYLAIGSLSTMLFAYIDVIMLGIFLSSEYVGYYSAAVSLFGTLLTLLAMSNLFVPAFVQLSPERLKISFSKIFKYLCMFSIPVVFGAIVLGKYLIKLFYGYSYLPAALPFFFLAPLVFSGIIIDTLISLFSSKEKPQYFVRMLIVSAIANIILNYVLITSFLKISPEMAMVGASISTLITRYFYMISIGISAKKIFGLEFSLNSFLKPFFAGAIMFVSLFLINSYSGPMTLLKGICEIFGGAIVYFFVLFLIKGVGRDEIIIMKSVLKKN